MSAQLDWRHGFLGVSIIALIVALMLPGGGDTTTTTTTTSAMNDDAYFMNMAACRDKAHAFGWSLTDPRREECRQWARETARR